VIKQHGRSRKWLSEKFGKSYVIVTNYCNNKVQKHLDVLNQNADDREVLNPTKV
jgi:hypothetical protein